MPSTTTPQKRMETAVKQSVNALLSAIANRKAHPSYGYSKSYITEKWQVLQGVCLGFDVAFLGGGGGSSAMSLARTLTALDYEWTTIQEAYLGVMRSGRQDVRTNP